jgi:hypothetical protein
LPRSCAPTPPGSGTNAAVGEGRFKTLQPNWRVFTFTTLTADQIAASPPPITVNVEDAF